MVGNERTFMRGGCMSLALVAALGLAGCAAPVGRACPAGMDAMMSESLYFGTASPRGPVTPEQWTVFLAETITPRFPDGLTVWPASGRRLASGDRQRDKSTVKIPTFCISCMRAPRPKISCSGKLSLPTKPSFSRRLC